MWVLSLNPVVLHEHDELGSEDSIIHTEHFAIHLQTSLHKITALGQELSINTEYLMKDK